MPEANNVQDAQIHEVVNWPSVIRKYWQNVGVVMEKKEGEVIAEQSSSRTTSSGGSGDTCDNNTSANNNITPSDINAANGTYREGVAEQGNNDCL